MRKQNRFMDLRIVFYSYCCSFLFWAVSEYIKGIFIFAGVAACVIYIILFFALGDIAQKVTEIHQHYQNKNI